MGAGPFYVAFGLIIVMLAWTTVLFVLSRKALRSAPPPDDQAADGFLWLFFVPALNEAVTIADSVERLLTVEVQNKRVIVIDDGSTDGTADALDEFEHPELVVLRRVPPDAGKGKAAALNAAWRDLDSLLASETWSRFSRDRVIVCVVDADGRPTRARPSSSPHTSPTSTSGVSSCSFESTIAHVR